MKTLFRTCVIICIGLLIFTLAVSYIQATGAFPISGSAGKDITDTSSALGDTTDLATPNMNYLWGIVIGGIAAGIVAGWITHSVVPTGVFIFSGVFWAGFINTHSILSIGGYVPGDLMTIGTICTVFVFIGACVGMLTGSG
ncbi:MAG: hypothetical protein GWN93_27225 [Deltaproteobacteria bacterium]|nr:hypothetical protein [Deltaproteobacteria bacterium]